MESVNRPESCEKTEQVKMKQLRCLWSSANHRGQCQHQVMGLGFSVPNYLVFGDHLKDILLKHFVVKSVLEEDLTAFKQTYRYSDGGSTPVRTIRYSYAK